MIGEPLGSTKHSFADLIDRPLIGLERLVDANDLERAYARLLDEMAPFMDDIIRTVGGSLFRAKEASP